MSKIKEILDKLKDENNYQVDCNDGSAFKELFASEISSLLDYITNLQEELKSIKENYKVQLEYDNNLEDKIANLQECYCNRTDCSGRIKDSKKYDSLQQRIDKAIEYIEEYQEVLKEHNGDWLNYQDGFKTYLLKILRGE